MRMYPAGIDHQQQHVDPLQRRRHFLHHLPSQRRIGFVQTGRVDKDDLPLRLGHNSLDAVARGLRLGSYDRDLLPDQSIYKRGLPRIRPPTTATNPTGTLFSLAFLRSPLAALLCDFSRLRYRSLRPACVPHSANITTSLAQPSSACESARAALSSGLLPDLEAMVCQIDLVTWRGHFAGSVTQQTRQSGHRLIRLVAELHAKQFLDVADWQAAAP